jgi:hypothetical protein
MSLSLDEALNAVPDGLRNPLIQLYQEALSDYRAARWESVGTKAGKICEVVYSIVHGKVTGTFPGKPSKPANMVDDCKKLEQHNKVHGRPLCIQVPRVLTAVYEMRNNREIGHVGSDVDPQSHGRRVYDTGGEMADGRVGAQFWQIGYWRGSRTD